MTVVGKIFGTVASAMTGLGAATFGVLVGVAMVSEAPGVLLDHIGWLVAGLGALVLGCALQVGGWIALARSRGAGLAPIVGAVLVAGVVITAQALQIREAVGQVLAALALMVALGVHAWLTQAAVAKSAGLGRTAEGFAGIGRVSSIAGTLGLAVLVVAFARQIHLPEVVRVSCFAVGFGGYALGQLALAAVFAASPSGADEGAVASVG